LNLCVKLWTAALLLLGKQRQLLQLQQLWH
jgi:hypothetical protein